MRTELSMDVTGMQVVPEQKLEERLGYVARIESVSSETERDFNFKGAVRVGIQNKTDILNGHSALVLSHEDFKRFMGGYDVKRPEYLVGKPVISVYTRDMGVALCGLIPLNLDR